MDYLYGFFLVLGVLGLSTAFALFIGAIIRFGMGDDDRGV